MKRNYLIDVAIAANGNYSKITHILKKNLPVPPSNYKGYALTILDANYPSVFQDLEQPPYVLFYQGDIRLLHTETVGIVGSRKPSHYALHATQRLVHKLKRSYTIVSGGARGIDAQAHKSALDAHTIVILGCGLNVVYPYEHAALYQEIARNHLILTEYPPGTKPLKWHFPFRNRLIASLSRRLYVMSATLRSGTLTTVNEALKLNRSISCLPHPIDDVTGYGCNMLIEEGAEILTSDDFL